MGMNEVMGPIYSDVTYQVRADYESALSNAWDSRKPITCQFDSRFMQFDPEFHLQKIPTRKTRLYVGKDSAGALEISYDKDSPGGFVFEHIDKYDGRRYLVCYTGYWQIMKAAVDAYFNYRNGVYDRSLPTPD